MDKERFSAPGYEGFEDIVQQTRDEEARLIFAEEQAERRLARARYQYDSALEKLLRSQRRVDKRQRQMLAAEDELRWSREMRAAGPNLKNKPESVIPGEESVERLNPLPDNLDPQE